MATLPNASVTLDTSGGAVGVSGTNLLCIISTAEKGPVNTPQIHASSAGLLSAFGRGEGTELAAHHLEVNCQVVCFIRATSATAGTISHSDETGVTGTSNVTFSGTPFDDEEIKVLVVTGGTIGTAGITIQTSRDGGLTYSGAIRLGTSTSYAIPGTGVTVNFAAGTLVAGDYATAYCVSPKWDSAGLCAGVVHVPPARRRGAGEEGEGADVRPKLNPKLSETFRNFARNFARNFQVFP